VFKRLFWLLVGFGSGLGTSWYVVRSVKRTVRRTVEAYAPAQLASRAGDGYRGARVNLRAAWTEGREAMREREAELRARVEADRVGRATGGDAINAEPVDAAVPDGAVAASRTLVTDELAARRRRPAPRPAGRARIGR
jgi:hypothetical protein